MTSMELYFYETREHVAQTTAEEEDLIREYAEREGVEPYIAANDLFQAGLIAAYSRSIELDHTIEITAVDE